EQHRHRGEGHPALVREEVAHRGLPDSHDVRPLIQPKSPEIKGAAMMAPPEMTAATMVARAAMKISFSLRPRIEGR
ncbi:hypothetical protein, partial [Streptomyces cyaneofuscatus]|uniref:hypothetical protein n=1 Tax=Streptomyces cyaneofuscatus TaxID=66883 RepID=UPI00343D8ECC